MPMDQLSRVMTWNRVYMEAPMLPNQSGNSAPKSPVAMTAKT
jgi:hypothetical protein